MKKKRPWKMSEGGTALFVGYLLLALIINFTGIVWLRGTAHWSSWVLGPLAVLSVFAFWRFAWRELRVDSRWRALRTWYEGSFMFSYLLLGFAAVVFIFGRTPVKFSSQPVPRATGWYYVYEAALPLAIGLAAFAIDRTRARGAAVKTPAR